MCFAISDIQVISFIHLLTHINSVKKI